MVRRHQKEIAGDSVAGDFKSTTLPSHPLVVLAAVHVGSSSKRALQLVFVLASDRPNSGHAFSITCRSLFIENSENRNIFPKKGKLGVVSFVGLKRSCLDLLRARAFCMVKSFAVG